MLTVSINRFLLKKRIDKGKINFIKKILYYSRLQEKFL